jgi:hypothetical protein
MTVSQEMLAGQRAFVSSEMPRSELLNVKFN